MFQWVVHDLGIPVNPNLKVLLKQKLMLHENIVFLLKTVKNCHDTHSNRHTGQ